jgi:hypothetical protein
MSDIRQLLERQSEWQKRRAGLSWPEKIHMAEAMRETVLEFQEMRRRLCDSNSVSGNAMENPKSTP